MSISFTVDCYTPLDRDAAQRLVTELEAIIVRYESALETGMLAAGERDTVQGLSIVTLPQLRSLEEDEGGGGISDDFSIVVSPALPPSADEARARAEATGYVTKLDPRALERLTSCRTTITLEYEGRTGLHPLAISVQRRLFEAIGPSVIVTGEGSEVSLSEAHVASFRAQAGSRWVDEPERTSAAPAPRSKRVPREAKGGELESVKIRDRLDTAIHDPLLAPRVQAAFRETTQRVRDYAAVLVEEGAQADARAAKTLECTAKEIAAARDELDLLLARCARAKGAP